MKSKKYTKVLIYIILITSFSSILVKTKHVLNIDQTLKENVTQLNTSQLSLSNHIKKKYSENNLIKKIKKLKLDSLTIIEQQRNKLIQINVNNHPHIFNELLDILLLHSHQIKELNINFISQQIELYLPKY
ncbi:hypothetical protein DID78_02740 [Candidatus Marinamargulisbacteria bacterium SCGC AG-343-D04]|nr:hypothetical protein DID78_02740 [Candidatus Marinamargulisbacteria bacterium SCGC AG-343-D04]